LICSFVMDNTIAGTRTERGLHIWDKIVGADVNNDPEYVRVYSLPLFLARVFRNCSYLEFACLGRMPPQPKNGYKVRFVRLVLHASCSLFVVRCSYCWFYVLSVYQKGGHGDIGDLCCSCLCNGGKHDDDDDGADADEESSCQ